MAKKKKQQQKDASVFETPAGVKSSPKQGEAVIHAMPKEFRGGSVPVTKAEPAKPVQKPEEKKPQPPAPKPVPPPVKKPSPKPGGQKKKPRRISPILLFVGVLALVGLVVLGILLVLPDGQDTVPELPGQQLPGTPEPPEEIPEQPTDPPPEQPPAEPAPGNDSDSDGLSNIEEILYGSNSRIADTDGDSFLDGNEVYHLYNPRAEAPGLLVDAGFVREYSRPDVSYTVFYPSRWTTEAVLDNTEGVLFIAPTGEFMQVLRQEKPAEQSLVEWYVSLVPGVDETILESVVTRQGYVGISNPDTFTTYLDVDGSVYVISYNLGEVKEINFLTTHQMVVNSFMVKSPEEQTE